VDYVYKEEQNSRILKYVKKPEPHSYYKIGDYSNAIKDPKPVTNYANLFKYNKKQDEELFICEKCQAPFSLIDELEVHTLTEHFDDNSKSSTTTSEKPTTEPMLTTEPIVEPSTTPMDTDDKK